MKLGMIRQPNAESFDYLKNKGLEFMEVCCNFDPESHSFIDNVAEIKANIARTGVPIGSVGRWNSAPNKAGKIDRDVMELNLALLRAAADVGSPVFVSGCNYDDSVSLFRNYCAAIENFGELVEEGKKLGVKVAVYNCDWTNFVHRGEHWKVVLGELPELMLKYDCSHSYARGQDYIGELNEWMPHVAHMHIKGTTCVNGQHVDAPPAGLDSIAWSTVFALIYRYGYDGGLSIEPHSSVWQGELGERGVDFTIDFIRKYMLR